MQFCNAVPMVVATSLEHHNSQKLSRYSVQTWVYKFSPIVPVGYKIDFLNFDF